MLDEFIKRAHDLLQDVAEENHKKHLEHKKSLLKPEKVREWQRKYCDSEKGIESIKKRDQIRRERLKKASIYLSWHEKKLIGKFYKNCPEGYEVDHIIPISKGGLHILSNLQYLTKQENRLKHDKLDWDSNGI